MTNSSSKTASWLSLTTAAVFFCMLLTAHFGHITQQYFEYYHTPEKYTEEIVEHSAELNLIFVFDNIFIVLYTCTALFAVKVLTKNSYSIIAVLAYILIVAVAVLDYKENFHIYALMQAAKNGNTVSTGSILWQVQESMLKWHLAYFEFFLIGFMLSAETKLERMLKYSLWFWFLPTGVLVYALRGTHAGALMELVRYLNLLSGFILLYFILRNKKEDE